MAETSALPWPAPYRHLRRRAEVGFWAVILVMNAIFNSLLVGIDLRHAGRVVAPWEPWFLEFSSVFVVAALVPLVVAWERRFPLHWDTLRRHLPWHLLGSLGYCSLHLAGMVAVRFLGFAALERDYALRGWWTEWGYEYLKDVRTYALIVSALVSYRFVLLRLQGEARVLDAPDPAVAPGPATPPVAAPASLSRGARDQAPLAAGSAVAPPAGPPQSHSASPPGPMPAPAPAPAQAADLPAARPERFLVRKLRREFLIAAADIAWLQAEANYVGLHVNGHDYLVRSTLTDFLQQLDPARFVRVHRSYAVNLDAVAEITPLDSGDARLHMKDGSTVPCSRRYRSALAPGAA